MAGGEDPVISDEITLKQKALDEVDTFLLQGVSRFEGGEEEVRQLIENDTQDILQFKEKQNNFDNMTDELEMEDDLTGDSTKFLAASVPGASLTGDFQDGKKGLLGKYPWETPPEINSIMDAFNFISDQKNKNSNKKNTLEIMYAGVPAEAISRTLAFKGFVEGLWTPDISELLIIPIMLDLVADAKDDNFTAQIFNDYQDDKVSENTVLDLMETLKPETFKEIKDEADMLSRMPVQNEEIPEVITGSFLDMEGEQDV